NIDITAAGVVTISGSKGVTVNGKAGSGVKVKCSNINVSAKSGLNLKGGAKAGLVASGKVTVKGATVAIN
ncbi:unnamed protein product, partial [Scytosiphon promiscuus]